MAIFRLAYVFVSKVNIIRILCRFGLVAPQNTDSNFEGYVIMSVTSAGSVCTAGDTLDHDHLLQKPPPLPPPLRVSESYQNTRAVCHLPAFL